MRRFLLLSDMLPVPLAIVMLVTAGMAGSSNLAAREISGTAAESETDMGAGASAKAAVRHPRHAGPVCTTPPENGAVLEGGANNPLVEFNKLVIENGYSGNAIVKLRDAATNKLFVSFFVGVSQTASYASIPDGSYVVQYGFGRTLNRSCTGFLSTRRAARNPAIEIFSAAYSDTRQVLTLKLYPVRRGNLKPQPIDEATFNAE